MAKVGKSYRFDRKTVELIEEISEREGVSATAAIERSVEHYACSIAEAAEDETDWKSLYFAEKERNDGLSVKLLELSGKVADSLRASQVLQAMGRPAFESAEQKEE